MSFAFHNIILNRMPVTYEAGRITINGSGLAYASEAAGSVTGLTVGSGDARYVKIAGDETVLGNKTFTGNTRVSGNFYVGGSIIDSLGNQSVDAKNYYLISNGVTSLDWTERSVSSSDSVVSMSWEDRALLDTSEIPCLNWGLRTLSGNWQTNTSPTLSGHLVNKAYLESITGSLGAGSIPSDVVRTTGNQTITGSKTFHSSTTFNNDVGIYGKLIATDQSDVSSVDTHLRVLYNDVAQETLNWLDGTTKNFDGAVTIDWRNSDLKSRLALSSGSVLNWEALNLFDYSGNYSADWNLRQFYTSVGYTDVSVDWESRLLSGNWRTNTSPTASNHLVNKSYVDTNSSFTLGFGHAILNTVTDSTLYYFGGFHGETPQSTPSDGSVVYSPTSGVLRSVVGDCFVAGTLSSNEDVRLVVSVNGTDVATGTYRTTGKNNLIQSGLQSINYNLNKYDAIQMRFSGNWGTNPTQIRHNLNAYITLG